MHVIAPCSNCSSSVPPHDRHGAPPCSCSPISAAPPSRSPPDRFSFPSGHATAALSVALSYAWFYPSLAAPIIAISAAVGASRVFLGVHYPGDVAAGQAIALAVHATLLYVGA